MALQRCGSKTLILLAMTALALPAFAAPEIPSVDMESADRGKTSRLEEIVVTARKREENLQQVPVSVTAFSGDQLKDQSVKSIVDLQAQVPGLYLQQGQDDPQALTFTLRGRKQNDTTTAVDPSVGLYIDGLYVPRTEGMAGSLLDINRAEVLRGPQGTLYGRNTTGGAIGIYTNNPTHELTGTVDVTAGNYSAWGLLGIFNVPINDNIAARFVMQRGSHSGYGHDANGDNLDSEDSQYYRAKILATWGDHWQALLSAHYESNKAGGSINKLAGLTPADAPVACGSIPAPCPPGGITTLEAAAETGLTIPQSVALLQSYVARSRSDFYDNEATQYAFSHIKRGDVGLTITADLSQSMHFKSITGFENLAQNGVFPSSFGVDYFSGVPHKDDKYFSQELQVLGDRPVLNWVIGAYGSYESGQDDVSITADPVVLGPNLGLQDAGIINTSWAGFGQATWEFIPAWHLTAGARLSTDTRKMNSENYQYGLGYSSMTCVVPAPGVESLATGGAAQCPRWFENSYTKPSWLVSLDHQLTADILGYAKVAAGYRSGGQNETGQVELASFAPFAPETNVEYESGIKSEFLDRKLRLNVDGFYDKYHNLQVTTTIIAPDAAIVFPVSNAASATILGMELDADAILAPGVSLHASSAYTDAYYNKFVDASGDRTGEPFSVPRWTWSVSPKYVRATPWGDLLVELDYNWRGSVVLDGHAVYRSQVTQSVVGLLDARVNLHWEAANMDVALFGKNVTGRKYHDQGFQLEQFGVNLLYAAPPATFGIELSKKLGR